MVITKKMDDIGRITIPRDIRQALRWVGGDEIEIILNKDNTILLKRHEDAKVQELKELSAVWADDAEIEQHFLELISLIESKN